MICKGLSEVVTLKVGLKIKQDGHEKGWEKGFWYRKHGQGERNPGDEDRAQARS